MVRDESYEIADYVENEFYNNKENFKQVDYIGDDDKKYDYVIEWSTLQDLIYNAVANLELKLFHYADNKEDAECYYEIETDVRGILGYRGFATNYENGDLYLLQD